MRFILRTLQIGRELTVTADVGAVEPELFGKVQIWNNIAQRFAFELFRNFKFCRTFTVTIKSRAKMAAAIITITLFWFSNRFTGLYTPYRKIPFKSI